jgi:hypothetical protein
MYEPTGRHSLFTVSFEETLQRTSIPSNLVLFQFMIFGAIFLGKEAVFQTHIASKAPSAAGLI